MNEVIASEEPRRPTRRAVLAAVLSVVPGAGHVYLGKRLKGAVLLVISLGIISSVFLTRSVVLLLLLVFPYLVIMIPAVIDAYFLAFGGVSRFSDSRVYIVVLLLTQGLWGLPVLWHSRVFSKREKAVWTGIVLLLTAVFFRLIFLYGKAAFDFAESWLGI